jgi:hypothetical protein
MSKVAARRATCWPIHQHYFIVTVLMSVDIEANQILYPNNRHHVRPDFYGG